MSQSEFAAVADRHPPPSIQVDRKTQMKADAEISHRGLCISLRSQLGQEQFEKEKSDSRPLGTSADSDRAVCKKRFAAACGFCLEVVASFAAQRRHPHFRVRDKLLSEGRIVLTVAGLLTEHVDHWVCRWCSTSRGERPTASPGRHAPSAAICDLRFRCCHQCLCAWLILLKPLFRIFIHISSTPTVAQTKSNADRLKGQRPAAEPCRLRELLLKHSPLARRRRQAPDYI